WGRLKGIFGKIFRSKVVTTATETGLKALPYLGVAMAKDEGEAGAALFLIAATQLIPGANIVVGVVAVAMIGAMVGHALYKWWKGPVAEVPNLELPPTEERVGGNFGPGYAVAYEQLPPEPGPPAPNTPTMQGESTSGPPAPNTLRMRSESN